MLFIKSIYHVLPISDDGVHIGLVTFSDVGNMVFNFQQHKTVDSLDMAVDQLVLPGGIKNNVGAGLVTTISQLFGMSGRKGTQSKKGVVTFVVGKIDDDPTMYSSKLKSQEIVSIVVAINSDMNQANLIASSPEHVLLIENVMHSFDYLDKVIDMINKG